ncbi:MAG: AIR synthase [Clostridiales bacterium]|nr:AIR synthase [Clostridiales bacterium]
MKDFVLPVGKLDSEVLKEIVFNKITFRRDEIITRPGIGEDCAAIDFGQYECVVSTDPITAAVSDIGRLSIHISCNDVASNGIEPLGILLAVMLPVGTTASDVERIMADAAKAAELCNVEIIGGHTEVTPAAAKPIIVSTAIGRAVRGASASAKDMKPGDFIYMTKTAGIEGTGIIACDFEKELLEVMTPSEVEEARNLLDLVSVIPEGLIGGEIGTSGMHDITEGGILGAVWEMCHVSGTGAEVYIDSIPVLDITRKVCDRFDINCLRLISSGCMLMVVTPENAEEMEKRMAEKNIRFTKIGVVTEEGTEVMAKYADGHEEIIDPPYADELYKVVGRE